MLTPVTKRRALAQKPRLDKAGSSVAFYRRGVGFSGVWSHAWIDICFVEDSLTGAFDKHTHAASETKHREAFATRAGCLRRVEHPTIIGRTSARHREKEGCGLMRKYIFWFYGNCVRTATEITNRGRLCGAPVLCLGLEVAATVEHLLGSMSPGQFFTAVR